MFPGVNGFQWSAGHVIFLGIFFTVLAVILGTMTAAVLHAVRDFRKRKAEEVKWQADFEDLPAAARRCRHELTGEVAARTCEHWFKCSRCEFHLSILRAAADAAMPDRGRRERRLGAGFDVPADRWYHRGHTWVHAEADGTYTIGLDDFGTRVFGTPDRVELPQTGSRIHANGAAWQMSRNGIDLRILSPITGVVVETGGPGAEWMLRVKAAPDEVDAGCLLKGGEVEAWLTREMERLQAALSSPGVGLTAADGGVPVADIPKAHTDANWDAIWGEVFLEP